MTTYPLLFFTSGTPINVGHNCAYERWLEFHAGEHGCGFKKVGQAIPLTTGAAVHQGIELIGRWVLDWQAAHVKQQLLDVPHAVTAWAATEAAARYEIKARARGLELTKRDVDSKPAIETLILEQRTLIEAQVWIYALARLPVMLASYRLLDVEREEGPVIDCTCGLGDWIGEWQQHAARQCKGIVLQGRSDFLWERLDGSAIVYEEFKTKATANYGWDQQWEHSGQLFRNMEAGSRRLGREISEAFVPVLYKGRRDRDDRDDKTQPKRQQSPLVYGYYDPGNGMTRMPEWAARYRWYDDYGKGHTLPRTYQRTAIWDESIALMGLVNPNGVREHEFRDDSSRVERWVRGWILPAQYSELLKVLGPFPKPRALVEDYILSALVEETDWRLKIARTRELKLYEPASVFTTHEGDRLTAANYIARSWNCTRFDGSSCQFKPLCFREPGWESIEGMCAQDGVTKIYEVRTPHHAIEREAFEQAGVVFPESEDEDDED